MNDILCTIYVCYYCLSLIGILLDKQHNVIYVVVSTVCIHWWYIVVFYELWQYTQHVMIYFVYYYNRWLVIFTLQINLYFTGIFRYTYITNHIIDEMHDLISDIFYFSLHVIQTRCKWYYYAILSCWVVLCVRRPMYSVCSVADVGQCRGCLLVSANVLFRSKCCHVVCLCDCREPTEGQETCRRLTPPLYIMMK